MKKKKKFLPLVVSLSYVYLTSAIQVIIAFVVCIVAIIRQIIKNIMISGLSPDAFAEGALEATEKVIMPSLLISSIVTILVVVYINNSFNNNYKKDLLLIKTTSKNMVLGLLLGISFFLINSGILESIKNIPIIEGMFKTFLESTSTVFSGGILIALIVGGVVAPIAEEFVFRGAIFNWLNKTTSVKFAIITQGILFGLIHLNIIQGIYATFIGIVLGYVTYKTKSIYPAIAAHIANNSIALIFPEIFNNLIINIIVLIIGLFILIKSIKLLDLKEIEE